MAGDTRELSPQDPHDLASGEIGSAKPAREPSKNFEVFHSANALPPGSGLNTAGSKLNNSNPTFFDALKTVRMQDFTQVHMYPCVRESLLMGIGAGFGVGGVRGVLGGELLLPYFYYPSYYLPLSSMGRDISS